MFLLHEGEQIKKNFKAWKINKIGGDLQKADDIIPKLFHQLRGGDLLCPNGASKGLNSEYTSRAGGGDLLCPTHVLIFSCLMCILQHFELLETFRLPPQQCSLIAFVVASVYY